MPYSTEYKLKNKDLINQKNKERYHKNKERYNETRRNNYKSKSKYYENRVKDTWNKAGIITFNDTFDKFVNATHCELCNNKFGDIGGKTTKDKKVLDHCHFSNYARFIICHKCNINNRKIDNTKMKLHLELYRYHKGK